MNILKNIITSTDREGLEKLELCPFCGGEAVRSTGEKGDGSAWEYIECLECGATAEIEHHVLSFLLSEQDRELDERIARNLSEPVEAKAEAGVLRDAINALEIGNFGGLAVLRKDEVMACIAVHERNCHTRPAPADGALREALKANIAHKESVGIGLMGLAELKKILADAALRGEPSAAPTSEGVLPSHAQQIAEEVYSYYTNMPGYEEGELTDIPSFGVILTLVQQSIEKTRQSPEPPQGEVGK